MIVWLATTALICWMGKHDRNKFSRISIWLKWTRWYIFESQIVFRTQNYFVCNISTNDRFVFIWLWCGPLKWSDNQQRTWLFLVKVEQKLITITQQQKEKNNKCSAHSEAIYGSQQYSATITVSTQHDAFSPFPHISLSWSGWLSRTVSFAVSSKMKIGQRRMASLVDSETVAAEHKQASWKIYPENRIRRIGDQLKSYLYNFIIHSWPWPILCHDSA